MSDLNSHSDSTRSVLICLWVIRKLGELLASLKKKILKCKVLINQECYVALETNIHFVIHLNLLKNL